ncbi:MAG: amidohydrolase family protein [SAR324 cluster bacterium]|jgi:predicted TIM-barrel fold metal-dependent hydrolase|nr:amidohydrolase family protein [SAR324 cluster bacterium]|tara:strand:- start:1311 stop:2270 length:960 start_codon:yes stop_codon:yes gene_type:complete
MRNPDLSIPTNLPDFSGLDLDFDIIDAHHHLFDLEQIYYPWLTDEPEKHFLLGNYDSLKRNYSCDDYRTDTKKLKVVKTVHVEAESDHQDPLRETEWLSGVMEHEGMPNAIVAHSWLHLPDSEKTLERQSEFPSVRGIRCKPVTSRNAETRDSVRQLPGSIHDPAWRKGLGLLQKYDFSWDLRVPFWHLDEISEVCRLYPDLPIVVEHTGLAWDRSEEALEEWRSGMSMLAELPHLFLKISELGLADSPWDYDLNLRVVREALELFGFERSMFGSNFPVAGLRIGFLEQVCAISHMIQDCSKTELDALFHDTAKQFYRL